ncbi:hypothetical protein HDU77_010532 [Chytriomyces hyalinus]|nr:hypothetical protein HDU77_010532 [Chytriomyces hyalinus]
MTPTLLALLFLAATFHPSSAQKDSSPLCGLCSTRTGEEIGCDSGLTCETNKSIGGSLGICVQPLEGSAACPSAAGTTVPAASTRTGPVAATLAVMSNASASSAVTSSSSALAASNFSSSSSSSSSPAASASMKSDCLPSVNALSVVLMTAISVAILI